MRMDRAHGSLDTAGMNDRVPSRKRRKATNLSVDERLLERARRMKLNLSQVFEASLADAIRRREAEEWLKRNRAALDLAFTGI